MSTKTFPAAWRRPARRPFDVALTGALVLLVVAAAAEAVDATWWWAIAAGHLRLHLGLAAAAVAAVLLLRRRRLMAAVAAIVAAVDLAPVAPMALAPASSQAHPAGPTFRLAAANVWVLNDDPGRLIAFLRREAPDVVVLSEVTPAFAAGLERIADLYPYRLLRSSAGYTGMAMLSKRPWRGGAIEVEADPGPPLVRAGIEIGGAVVTVLGAHVYPPEWGGIAALQQRQLARLTRLARAVDGPLVVAGDLNVTPWSRDWRRLVAATRLAPPSDQVPTWPAWIAAVGIPIDHVLAANGAHVVAAAAGPLIGSDHRPLLATISLGVTP